MSKFFLARERERSREIEREREVEKSRKLFFSCGSVSRTSHFLTAVFFSLAVFSLTVFSLTVFSLVGSSSPCPRVVIAKMDTSSSPELPNVGKSDIKSKSQTKRDRKRKIITSDEVVTEETSSLEQSSDTVYSCMTLE